MLILSTINKFSQVINNFRVLCRLSVLCLCAVITVFVIFDVSLCSAERSKVFVIGGDDNFPPYEYVSVKEGIQSYRGFNVDIMRAIALQTGIEIEFRPMTWADALQALDNGEIDAIQGMKYDSERLSKYDFSDEYITSSQVVFVLSGMYISELDELRDHKVAVQKGDIAYQNLKSHSSFSVVAVPNQEEAFKLLLAGEVTAVIGNKLAGQYILQRNNQVDNVKMIGPDIDPHNYGVAVKKGNTELIQIINTGLREIKKNGTYDKISKKWFGELIDHPSSYYKDRLILVITLAVVLFLGLIAAGHISFMLKNEVAKRTREIAGINKALMEKNEYIKRENLHKEKILNSGYSGIITLNQDGIIQFINDYAVQYMGVSNAIGLHYSSTPIVELFPQDDIKSIFRETENMIRGEKNIRGYSVEYTICLLSQDEIMEGIVISFRDITLEKRMHEQLIRKDKMEALGSLVAGIAHEIRTPLTSIKMFTELLPVKYESVSFRQQISRFVPQEVERINDMVNSLLEYARPRKPSPESFGLNQLVENVLILFTGHIEKHCILITHQIDDQITVFADKQQIQQVLINILLNAIEAMEEQEKKKIAISCSSNEHSAVMVIEDSGLGMNEEIVSKIFDPFFTTKPLGTGLGLAISYKLVRENNGRIWPESLPGIGTKLYIELPRSSCRGGKSV